MKFFQSPEAAAHEEYMDRFERTRLLNQQLYHKDLYFLADVHRLEIYIASFHGTKNNLAVPRPFGSIRGANICAGRIPDRNFIPIKGRITLSEDWKV